MEEISAQHEPDYLFTTPGGGSEDLASVVAFPAPAGVWSNSLPIDFPPRSTVWRCFDPWRRDGTWDRIHDRLRSKVRPTPTRCITSRS